MPLQRDTFSINLSQGINEKIDDKVAGPDQTSVVKDCVINKEGRLQKRYGQTVKSTTVQTSFTNPLSITTSSYKTKTFAHENQLCQINSGALYSQMSSQDKWVFKGHCPQIGVSVNPVAQGVALTDIVTVSGITVAAGGGNVYVREDATGSTIATVAVSNILRLVAFTNAIWVLWESGNTLKAQQVSLTDGSLGAAVNLQTDLVSNAVAKNVSVATTNNTSAVGECAFIAYCSTTNIKVFPMTSAGSVPALGTLDTGTACSAPVYLSIYIQPDLNANKFYLARGGTSNVWAGAWTFSSSVYSNVFGLTSVMSPSLPNAFCSLNAVTMMINPINNTELYLFADTRFVHPTTSAAETNSCDSAVYYAILSLTGTVTTAATVYAQGLELAATPVRDTERNTIYLPCVFYSPLQTTLVLVDILKGKSSVTTYVVAKCLYGLAAQPTVLSKCRITSGGGTTYRMVNNGYAVDFTLSSTYAVSSAYSAKTTHLTGGLLWSYDGAALSEHNFLLAPEITSLWIGQAYLSLVVNQVGDASHKEKFTLTFQQGGAFSTNGTATYGYVQFNSLVTGYYLWFKVDGAGNDPAPGGRTGIQVSINSTDTAEDVAYKVDQAVSAVVGSNRSFPTANSWSFELTGNGAVTAPSLNGNYTAAGSLTAGSYQFCAVYKWTDRNGNVYRSAPSVAQTATALANDRASFLVWAPSITNRAAANVTVEIYRTQVNVSELQLLSSALVMTDTTSRLNLSDGSADTAIASNAIIYTNDGTLENYNVGACSALSAFKNRLLVTVADDPTAAYYSRTNVNGEPINFSQFNAVRMDQDGQPITAHAQMDDKLVLFKAASIGVTAGDGSNDLGQGETFQLPMQIPGDFGTSNPNSLALCPTGLLFQTPTKGIQVLSRGLAVEYLGAAVDDYKSNVVSGAVTTTNYEQIVFSLSDSTTSLVYNYRFNRWDLWTNQQGDSSCLWQSAYVRAKNNGKVYVESSNYYDVDGSNLAISEYIETVWLKVKYLQGFSRVYTAMLLGEYLSAHTLTVKIYYDFDTINFDTHTFDAATVIGAGGSAQDDQVYQVEISPARQKCDAIKFVITETPGSGTQASAYFHALDLFVGVKGGLNKVKNAKSI